MWMISKFPVAVLVCLFAAPSMACEIGPGEPARITNVMDAVTFELGDGRTLRLEGLGSPRPPARAAADTNWPIAIRAAAYARAMMEGKTIAFSSTAEVDRYGRIIAQVFLSDGTWVNGALVGAGFARIETAPDQTRCAEEALVLEAAARSAARGMWDLSAYEVRSSEEAAAFTNDFQIVEGTVLEVTEIRDWTYLNFGTDWRTDFTLSIARRDRRRFEAAGLDPQSLAGRRVRVRGWLEWYNGPMIEFDHPEQVEILTTGPGENAGGGNDGGTNP